MSSLVDRFDPLFNPKSVAVIGASNTPGKWGFGILHNLMAGGYTGKIFPVNRKEASVQGLPAFASARDLPEAPDLAMVIVPPAEVPGALRELIGRGVRSSVIITGGFSELGPEGARLEDEIEKLARDNNLPVIGPNCMGIVNVRHRLHTQILLLSPPPGPLSIVSQSGNIVGSIMHYGNVNRVGFNKAVSSGNEAVIEVHELIDYLGEDETTGAVLLYLEGVNDGRVFFEAVKKASRKKPVVILKGGQSEAGGAACASHTGHLAGRATVFLSAARQAGAVLVNDLDELYHAGAVIASHPRPRGKRVGIVTMGGGWGVLAADQCSREGLEIAPLSPATIEKLNPILTDRWSHANPVDLAATPDTGAMIKATRVVAESGDVDMIIQTNLGFGGAAKKHQTHVTEPGGQFTQVIKFPGAIIDYLAKGDLKAAEAIVEMEKEHGVPIVSCTDVIIGDSVKGNPTLELMAQNGIPVYPTPVKAARMLGLLCRYWQWRDREEKTRGT